MKNKEQPKHFDSIRPDGVCYYASIQDGHKSFCEKLGNGTIKTNHEIARQAVAGCGVKTIEKQR